jgi:hypothetical protein
MNVVMEEEQEMDATERSRKECNRHDGPMVPAFRSFVDVVAHCVDQNCVPQIVCLWPPRNGHQDLRKNTPSLD